MAEVIPYEIKFNDESMWLLDKPDSRLEYLKDHPEMEPRTLGLVALGVFRNKSYVDYLAIGQVDDHDDSILWTRIHEMYEWLDWLGGTVYRDTKREKQLRDTERELGQFLLQFGWAADWILETEPSESEMESYITHVVRKDTVNDELFIPQEGDGS